MGKDPEWSEELNFLKKLKEAAAFYIKHNAQKDFVELISSIPTPGKPLKNNKKCINTSEKKSEGNRNKTQHKNKHENKSESKKTRCILCKKTYVCIKGHYRSLHKIDDDFWIKNVTDKDVQRNGTTCPICEIDHISIKSLRKHLIDYHKIKLLAKKRKACFKDKKGQTRVVGETAKPKEIEPMVNDPAVQEERKKTEDYPITQNREITEPAAQDGQIKRNPHVQNKREEVVIHDVQKLCKHCNKFVSVSSIDSHIASHHRERETFPFKTSYSNQNAACSQSDNASHSYETTDKIESRKQCENETVAHSNNGEEQSMTTDNETEGSSIQNEEQFQTTRDSQEDVGIDNSKQDNANDVIPQNMMNNEEQRQAQEDVRKSRFKLLWKEYYRRMLVANENGKKELYDKFLNEYASLGNRGVVCHRRSNFASIDAKRRQRRVDDVSMITMESLTSCHSGVSFTQKRITYLKTIRYETNEYFVGTD